MRELLERESIDALDVCIDERPARAQLRAQIGRLERELAGLFGEAFGRVEIEHRVAALSSRPKVLGLGELERQRDALATRIATARQALRERVREEDANRARLRAMLAAPAEHKWELITRAEIGEPGCGAWHSRPRFGPIGMVMGWWQVKVSSGCPLAGRLTAVEQAAQADEEAAAGL